MKQKSKGRVITLASRNHDITIEEVKALESFKDYNDEQALQLIQTIKTFTQVVYGLWVKEQASNKVISLPIDNYKNKVA